jgi:hypothetical protein
VSHAIAKALVAKALVTLALFFRIIAFASWLPKQKQKQKGKFVPMEK